MAVRKEGGEAGAGGTAEGLFRVSELREGLLVAYLIQSDPPSLLSLLN